MVVTAKLDRLGRSWKHLANLFDELDNLGVEVVSVAEQIDSSTPTGRLFRSQLAGFAEFERARITERAVDGLRRTVAIGGWPGGPPPFGYQLASAPPPAEHKVLEFNGNEYEQLHLVFRLVVLEGKSVYEAARLLTALGYRTRRGQPWRHPNLCYRLRQPYLTGTWTYNQGGDPIEVSIPAIFTQEQWGQLQAAIKAAPDPNARTGSTHSPEEAASTFAVTAAATTSG